LFFQNSEVDNSGLKNSDFDKISDNFEVKSAKTKLESMNQSSNFDFKKEGD
jgi:hypothetical protein